MRPGGEHRGRGGGVLGELDDTAHEADEVAVVDGAQEEGCRVAEVSRGSRGGHDGVRSVCTGRGRECVDCSGGCGCPSRSKAKKRRE